jgi:hypothetical protein
LSRIHRVRVIDANAEDLEIGVYPEQP